MKKLLIAVSIASTTMLGACSMMSNLHEKHAMVKDMNAMQYIEHMIPHHQEAVISSQYVLDRTANSDLKAFLTKVIATQTQEVEMMKQWYMDWYRVEYKDNGSYKPMMRDLTEYSGDDLDEAYAEDMIKHHKMAIKMSKNLKQDSPKELNELAKNIITTQKSEIEQLEKWD